MKKIVKRPAFTLVELLVVIAIIGMLVGLLLPAIQVARRTAMRMQCQNREKQITLAALNYESSKNYLPPAGRAPGANSNTTPDGVSGFVLLLEYIEQDAQAKIAKPFLSQKLNQSMVQNGKNFNELAATVMSAFRCPGTSTNDTIDETGSDSTAPAISNYKFVVASTQGMYQGAINQGGTSYISGSSAAADGACPFGNKGRRLSEIQGGDGASNTLHLSESNEQFYARWVVGLDSGIYTYYDRNVGQPVRMSNQDFYAPSGYASGKLGADNPTYADKTPWTNLDREYEDDPYEWSSLSNSGFKSCGSMSSGTKYGPSSGHSGVVIHTYLDNSVHSISIDIDPAVYFFATTYKGKEVSQAVD